MIHAISKLDPNTRRTVLKTLAIRGKRSRQGHYQRYTLSELEHAAMMMQDSHTLSPAGLERWIQGFNSVELDLIETLMHSEEDVSQKVRQSSDRTRLAVRRIVSKIDKEQQREHPGFFQRIKSAWSHHPSRS